MDVEGVLRDLVTNFNYGSFRWAFHVGDYGEVRFILNTLFLNDRFPFVPVVSIVSSPAP